MSFHHALPSRLLVLGTLALVAALAGTAVAADPVATTSVGKKKVKKIARKQADKRITARAPDLSVAHADTAATSNIAGTAGRATTAGTADRLGEVTVQRQDANVANGINGGAMATCPDGQQALTGGVSTTASDAFVTTSQPVRAASPATVLNDGDTFDAWRAFATNQAGGSVNVTVRVWVVCAG